jgi:aryl-alcohol dehydrogenase-like predicted oxidoreductase
LQFARSAPGITSAVAGMREPDHIDENLEVAAVPPLSPDTIDRLFKESGQAET